MESGLRPAGCRPPLTSLFRQILRTLGAQNRREDTNLAKAGFLILALHGTVGLFFYLPGFGICRKRERNTESAARGKYRSAFFLSGKEYLHLAEGRKAAESDEKRQAAAMPFVVQKLRQRGHAAGDVHRRIQQTRQKNEATAPDARFPAAEVPLSARRARNNRKIRPEICPNMRACADFLECFTPIPLEKQRNSFSNFENTPAFRAPSAQCGRFIHARRTISSAEAHPSARRGYADNLRSGHIRARDNRGIRPEICPNIRTARIFFDFFKKISFSVQRKGKKYRLYNIRTLLCTSKCSAGRASLRPHKASP